MAKYCQPDPERLPILIAAMAMKYQRKAPDVWCDEVGRECLLRDYGDKPWIPPPPTMYRPGGYLPCSHWAREGVWPGERDPEAPTDSEEDRRYAPAR